MDFGDTPEEAAFRAEAHAFLSRHARRRAPGEETIGFLADTEPEAEAAHNAAAKEWQATLYREGWAGITWPKENGGRGGTLVEALIFDQELARCAERRDEPRGRAGRLDLRRLKPPEAGGQPECDRGERKQQPW